MVKKWKDFLYEQLTEDTPDVGDYVKIINFEGLSDKQTNFLKSKDYFRIKNITDRQGNLYTEGTPYAEVGYNIPLKLSRFEKIGKPKDLPKYNILFLQFNLAIDLHGEEDINNFFKGQKTMESLFELIFKEKSPDIGVDFYNYNEIYKIDKSYYIQGTDIKDYDFVFFGFMSKHSQMSKIIINYLDRFNRPYLKYETFNTEDNKAYGMDIVEQLGYPYIPTILTYKLSNNIIKHVNNFGFPVIVKDINLDRGIGVFKIDNLQELIQSFQGNNSPKMIQKFIPNTGDFRVIVIKNETKLVIKRQQTSEKEFRSNVALGGKAVKASLPERIIRMCEDISKHLYCDIIGFDILQDKNRPNDYYVMEANISPHFSTFSVVSEINIPDIIANYIISEIKQN